MFPTSKRYTTEWLPLWTLRRNRGSEIRRSSPWEINSAVRSRTMMISISEFRLSSNPKERSLRPAGSSKTRCQTAVAVGVAWLNLHSSAIDSPTHTLGPGWTDVVRISWFGTLVFRWSGDWVEFSITHITRTWRKYVLLKIIFMFNFFVTKIWLIFLNKQK